MTPEYPWMQHACYEPRPLPRRANRALHIFLTLAAIAIATGILLAIN